MLLDATEIRLENTNMTTVFDRHGIRYEIPIFVINDPVGFNEGKMAPSRRKKETVEEEISFKIRCFNVSHNDTDMKLVNTTTIGELKAIYNDTLETKLGVEVMRVFFGGKELKNEETIM
jgi:hypothetical protein